MWTSKRLIAVVGMWELAWEGERVKEYSSKWAPAFGVSAFDAFVSFLLTKERHVLF